MGEQVYKNCFVCQHSRGVAFSKILLFKNALQGYIYSVSNLKITIIAAGKNDVTIGVDYEMTLIQRELEDGRDALQKQVNGLKNYIQKGK